MESRDTPRAECQRRNGSWNRTSIDLDRCGRGGTVANMDGNLVCESFGTQGGSHGPWWGRGLPAGSHQRNCRNARIEGRDLLIAQCQRRKGEWRNTRLDIDEYRGRDIPTTTATWNEAARPMAAITASTSCRPDHGTRAAATPGSSATTSTPNAASATATGCAPALISTIAAAGAVSNNNGRLVCGRVGNQGGYLPAGSWQQSCRNPRFEGGRFHADCRKQNGVWRSDGIDLDDCKGRPLYNDNGKLRC